MSNMTSIEKTATLALTAIIIPSIKQGNFKLLMASLGTEDEALKDALLEGLAAIYNSTDDDGKRLELGKKLMDITTENYFDKEQWHLGIISTSSAYDYGYHLFNYLCECWEPTEDDREEARAEGIEL